MANPPGVNVTVNTPSPSPQTNAPTGTWFVSGVTAGGPVGVAVPVNSMQDFNTYFGIWSNGAVTGRNSASSTTYDALDVYFREGGVRAYVSRAVLASATGAASGTLTLGTNFASLTASGLGAWSNAASGTPVTNQGLQVVVATGGSGVTLTVNHNGVQIGNTSPPLFTASDVTNWVNSQSAPGTLFTCGSVSGAVTLPSAGTYGFTGGNDGTGSPTIQTPTDANYATALTFFTLALGPGQVSVPGVTSATTYQNLGNHAYNFNRVAILDAVDTATAATLITNATAVQIGGANPMTDSSYAAVFGPWLKVPGIPSTTPNTIAPTFTRTVAPCSAVAANIAAVDYANDSNVPAAGVVNGSSSYATDVTQTYSASDRVSLNAAGVNVIRNISGTVAIYGFRSLSTDTNWVAFNNVRFRMQIINDLDVLSEPFVFAEIDGKGQVFARLAGVLSGQCQQYWLRDSLYGVTPDSAFSVNTGPQVNTPATIANGQINAQVNLRMSPQAEQVSVTVTKYLVSSPLPSY